ncbi:MAG: hypothetical protein WAL56_12765 [Candidatus Sulfotelmatobacter sp.]
MLRLWNYFFRVLLRIAPGFVERFLQYVNREPSYRKIFILTRESTESHA